MTATRIELYDDFDPRREFQLTVDDPDLLNAERNAERGVGPDDIELDVPGPE